MQKNKLKGISIPAGYNYIIKVYLILLFIFFLSRLALLFLNYNLLTPEAKKYIMPSVFNYGLRFDISFISYSLFLPFLLLSFNLGNHSKKHFLFNITHIYVQILIIFSIAICATDIPNFSYYNSRVTKAIFTWTDKPLLMIKALISYKNFYLFFTLFLIFSFLFYYFFKKLKENTLNGLNKKNHTITKLLWLFVFVIIFAFGMRGRISFSEHPIILIDSYFTKHTFINQLCVNPFSVFVSSFYNSSKQMFEEDECIEKVQNALNIKNELNLPVARQINFDTVPEYKNIVIILVESLSARQMKFFGNKKNLTPFLDSLANQSLFFTNIYSSGVHTHNALYSVILGHPSLPGIKHTKWVVGLDQQYYGLPQILKENNFHTSFYCSGDIQFDNMQGFLEKNKFDEIVSKDDFKKNEIINVWGASDFNLYKHSISKMDSLNKNQNKFLSVILTVSAHEGTTPPLNEGYRPRSTKNTDRLYEYTDWAIQQFFELVSTKEWYNNTVFVILGDHGQNFNPVYEIPLAYVHIPLIIFEPGNEAHIYNNIGMQIDVSPTVLGLLKTPYINNTFGIDLLNEVRPFAYFVRDKNIGCIDDEYYLIIPDKGKEGLFKYKNKDLENLLESNKAQVKEMEEYTYSMLQLSEWMVKNKKVGKPKIN